jgi:hypothetical protein
MPDRAVLPGRGPSDGLSRRRIVFQAVMSLWAYSAACGAIAVGVGYLAGAAFASLLPALVIRISTIALFVLAGGLNGPRVVTHVEKRLGLLPDVAAADSWVNQAKREIVC